MCAALAAACVTAFAAPRSAHAQQTPPAAERWYGWQILLVDAAGLGAMTGGGVALARTNSAIGAGFFYGGVVVSHFGGPVVHAIHGSHAPKGEDTLWKSGLSYGMRVLLPVTGLLVGFAIGEKLHCEPRDGCVGGMIAGWTGGSYAASIIDVAALGWEKVPPKPAVPALLPVKGGFVAGLSGVF